MHTPIYPSLFRLSRVTTQGTIPVFMFVKWSSLTHILYNDVINTTMWLPTAEHWPRQFLGAGCGGWVTGAHNTTLAWAASKGLVVITTNSRHVADATMKDWALLSHSNISQMAL